MKKYVNSLILTILIWSLLIQLNTPLRQSISISTSEEWDTTRKVTQEQMVKVDIKITAPTGPSMQGNTPIIIKLSDIAENVPAGIDAFGENTTTASDDLKWNAAYVTYSDSLIPSQVDDIDGIPGFSENDELVFGLPETVNLDSGDNASFSVFLSNKALDLPPPYFPEVCTLYIYPKIDMVNTMWPNMLGPGDGAYYIENEIIQACAIPEAAWSSGGLYELSILDEEGNSQWDIIKQKFRAPPDNRWEVWKWSRFALIEQFASRNQFASTFPARVTQMITGPVRARIQMQSTQNYGKDKTVWGLIPDVFGLMTYDLFAGQAYLDYTLETVGPKASEYPELWIMYSNREWGGRPGSPYKGIYVPGTEWVDRNPNDIEIHSVEKSGFSAPWYLEGLQEGQTISGGETFIGPNDDKLGYGFVFDDTGFVNITWDAISEEVKSMYNAAQFPFRTRYYPYDISILGEQKPIDYMENKYQEWSRPEPEFQINSSLVSITGIPFDHIFVSKPDIDFDNDTELLHIANISAFSTVLSEYITGTTPDVTPPYKVLFDKGKSETGQSGALVWDSTTEKWGAQNIAVSSLNLSLVYVVMVYFETPDLTGSSPPSERFSSGAIVDTTPPIFFSVSRQPADAVRYMDSVNITADIRDEEGEISEVILSFSNGSSWYNTSMNFSYGFYKGTIPPHKQGTTVKYKIYAWDDVTPPNYNVSIEYSYNISVEYVPGQGILPLVGVSAILIIAVIIALKSGAIHRQQYDQID